MDNAVSAVNKLFAKDPVPSESETQEVTKKQTRAATKAAEGKDVDATVDVAVEDTTVDSKIAPAVEHTHVKKQHETREQTVVEKEKHQDHYHTTIQPLKDNEVLPEKHDHIHETKHRKINHDDSTAKAQWEADRAGLEDTKDEQQFESKTKEVVAGQEHIHHHLHETIQPVIEKEVIVPSVTHKKIVVKEKIQEASEHHGVTTNSAISVEDFKKKLAGGEGAAAVEQTAVVAKDE